jgi:hypothetical protein
VVEINGAVQLEHMSHTYDSPVLQQLTMRLYTEIFSYLIKFMTWFTSNSRTRFLKSFNETNLNLFKEDLAQVKQISTLLSRQVQLHMSDDVRISRLLMENLSDDMRYLLKFSDVGERYSRVRDATNAQLLQKTFQSQLEKTKEEILSCVMGVMGDYNELVRSNASGVGMTNLLKMQASPTPRSRSPQSPTAARKLAPRDLHSKPLRLTLTMARLTKR